MAVYRFIIIDGKACIDDNQEQGVWVSKKRCTYTTHMARIGWKASFECLYADAGNLNTLKVLDINEDLKSFIDLGPDGDGTRRVACHGMRVGPWKGRPKSKAKERSGNCPMKARGGTKNDNGNNLIRFDLIYYTLGIKNARKEVMVVWWGKKFPVSQSRS